LRDLLFSPPQAQLKPEFIEGEAMKRGHLLGVGALALTGCGSIDNILFAPETRPDQWCSLRPCVDLGGVILNEPLGSFLVYLLAAMSLWAGWQFWKNRGAEKSRYWWAWALMLGGVAAACAGTSYQAFSYELKCAGRSLCVFTSWWEVVYMTVQNASVDCMVIAVAYSSTTGKLRQGLIKYAFANAGLHLLATIYGAATGNAFLISFELLLLFSTPALLAFLVLNGTRYVRHRTRVDAILLGAWVWLFATNALYYAYFGAGLTQRFWQNGQGFYFSENDVLHVGMIGWMLYFFLVVAKAVSDLKDDTATG